MIFVAMLNYAFDRSSLKDFCAWFLYGGVGQGFEEIYGLFGAWKNWDLEHDGGFEDESGVLILFAEERFCDFLIVRISLEVKSVEISSFVEYPWWLLCITIGTPI